MPECSCSSCTPVLDHMEGEKVIATQIGLKGNKSWMDKPLVYIYGCSNFVKLKSIKIDCEDREILLTRHEFNARKFIPFT